MRKKTPSSKTRTNKNPSKLYTNEYGMANEHAQSDSINHNSTVQDPEAKTSVIKSLCRHFEDWSSVLEAVFPNCATFMQVTENQTRRDWDTANSCIQGSMLSTYQWKRGSMLGIRTRGTTEQVSGGTVAFKGAEMYRLVNRDKLVRQHRSCKAISSCQKLSKSVNNVDREDFNAASSEAKYLEDEKAELKRKNCTSKLWEQSDREVT